MNLAKSLRLKGLIAGGFVPAGAVYDKLGNPAVLDSEGLVSFYGSSPSSLTASASEHNFVVNNSSVKKNGWYYWHVDVNGELVPLHEFRQHFHDTVLLKRLRFALDFNAK